MVSICMYFQVHQPFRLNNYTVFDIGNNSQYYDAKRNEEICKKIAKKCYLPTNKILLEIIKQTNFKLKIAFSISGVALEQFALYTPEVIKTFKELAASGCVEFLSETYYHSFVFLHSKEEFLEQIKLHQKIIKKHFNQEPKVFRNTELIFNNDLARFIALAGYKGILAEGTDTLLEGKSANVLYEIADNNSITANQQLKILSKNNKLSDDIAFRFSNKHWEEWPLTAEKYAHWINSSQGDTINLFMDYETFGEHQWEDSGIFDFLRAFPEEILKNKNNHFLFPSEIIQKYNPKGTINKDHFISWNDIEQDLSPWLGNKMQQTAFEELDLLGIMIKKTNDSQLIEDWRKLQSSDHLYYMCTEWTAEREVHKYFNPYGSPYDAFIIVMNIMKDMRLRVQNNQEEKIKQQLLTKKQIII